MACTTWGSFFDIEERLLKEGPKFSFLQAIRLIRLLLRRLEECDVKDAASIEGNLLRVRPFLSLGFPAADISNITEQQFGDHQRYLIEATFLGMYGISSPLPSFYTEDLLYEVSDDITVTRDFLDILNTVTYQLFIRTLLKYNLFLQVVEEHNESYLEYLYYLAGLGDIREGGFDSDAMLLLRYGGILNQFPRSALGLRTILREALGVEVTLEQCVPCRLKIPDEDIWVLGIRNNVLGETTHLGSETQDAMEFFRIVIGPVPAVEADDFLPGGVQYNKAEMLTSHYLDRPLDYEFKILIDGRQVEAICLGAGNNNCLGVTTWFRPLAGTENITAFFSGGNSMNENRRRPWRE